MDAHDTSGLKSVRELAKDFKISEKNLKGLIQKYNIPTVSIKTKVLVNAKQFDNWMASNIKHLDEENLFHLEKQDSAKGISISDLLDANRVIFNPPDYTKGQILKRLVEQLVASKSVPKKHMKAILQAVVDRERLCSTAISDGVAIPHPRSSLGEIVEKPLLVVAISPRGVDFESEDGKKTNLFFLICAPTTDIHLRVMARLSRLLRSNKFRHLLVNAKNFAEVSEIFISWEKKLAKPSGE